MCLQSRISFLFDSYNLIIVNNLLIIVSKSYQEKQERKIQDISDRYEEAKQIADKTFEIVEGQLQKLETYVENGKLFSL